MIAARGAASNRTGSIAADGVGDEPLTGRGGREIVADATFKNDGRFCLPGHELILPFRRQSSDWAPGPPGLASSVVDTVHQQKSQGGLRDSCHYSPLCSRSLATKPVQPVWWLAPSPAPLSP